MFTTCTVVNERGNYKHNFVNEITIKNSCYLVLYLKKNILSYMTVLLH